MPADHRSKLPGGGNGQIARRRPPQKMDRREAWEAPCLRAAASPSRPVANIDAADPVARRTRHLKAEEPGARSARRRAAVDPVLAKGGRPDRGSGPRRRALGPGCGLWNGLKSSSKLRAPGPPVPMLGRPCLDRIGVFWSRSHFPKAPPIRPPKDPLPSSEALLELLAIPGNRFT